MQRAVTARTTLWVCVSPSEPPELAFSKVSKSRVQANLLLPKSSANSNCPCDVLSVVTANAETLKCLWEGTRQSKNRPCPYLGPQPTSIWFSPQLIQKYRNSCNRNLCFTLRHFMYSLQPNYCIWKRSIWHMLVLFWQHFPSPQILYHNIR